MRIIQVKSPFEHFYKWIEVRDWRQPCCIDQFVSEW